MHLIQMQQWAKAQDCFERNQKMLMDDDLKLKVLYNHGIVLQFRGPEYYSLAIQKYKDTISFEMKKSTSIPWIPLSHIGEIFLKQKDPQSFISYCDQLLSPLSLSEIPDNIHVLLANSYL